MLQGTSTTYALAWLPALQVALGSELAQLLRVELPARDVHLVARRPGCLADVPNQLL